jgi:hypothetical protein
MARTVAPLDPNPPDLPRDERLEVVYSTVVLLVVAFTFWTFPVRVLPIHIPCSWLAWRAWCCDNLDIALAFIRRF